VSRFADSRKAEGRCHAFNGAVREGVAFSAEEVRDGLRRLAVRGVVSESVIVSTCHRSEIYGLGAGERTGDELAQFVSEWRGLDRRVLEQAGFRRFGAEAVRHLFRVAVGLDSMALGESEVLGQVRQALSIARETGSTRGVLHRLFESAVRAGKRVRTETQIAVHPLSIASIAVELAEKVFGDLPKRSLLLLGAGETATLFARHAVEAGLRDAAREGIIMRLSSCTRRSSRPPSTAGKRRRSRFPGPPPCTCRRW